MPYAGCLQSNVCYSRNLTCDRYQPIGRPMLGRAQWAKFYPLNPPHLLKDTHPTHFSHSSYCFGSKCPLIYLLLHKNIILVKESQPHFSPPSSGQCKHHRLPLGPRDVREFESVLQRTSHHHHHHHHHYNHHQPITGVIISHSG